MVQKSGRRLLTSVILARGSSTEFLVPSENCLGFVKALGACKKRWREVVCPRAFSGRVRGLK